MAIVHKKGSINLDGLNSTPVVLAGNKTVKGDLTTQIEKVEVAASDEDTSTYTIATVQSNSVLSRTSEIFNDAITGATDYDLGFYYTDGTVIDADALAATLNFTSAGSTKLLASVNIDQIGKSVWELAGLTEDPNKLIDIRLTANTVGTAAGTISAETNFS